MRFSKPPIPAVSYSLSTFADTSSCRITLHAMIPAVVLRAQEQSPTGCRLCVSCHRERNRGMPALPCGPFRVGLNVPCERFVKRCLALVYKRDACCASHLLSNFLSFIRKAARHSCAAMCVPPRQARFPRARRLLLSHAFSHFSGVNRTCRYVTTPTTNRTAVKPISHDI